jgi:hypothetical protein
MGSKREKGTKVSRKNQKRRRKKKKAKMTNVKKMTALAQAMDNKRKKENNISRKGIKMTSVMTSVNAPPPAPPTTRRSR